MSFDPNEPHEVFPRVLIKSKSTTTKGKPCVLFQWFGGHKKVYDASLYDAVNEGDEVTIKCNYEGDGEFRKLVNFSVSKGTKKKAAGDTAASLV